MNISEETKKQIKMLTIPIIWYVIFLCISGSFDKMNRVYCDLIFYLGLTVYFITIGDISFKSLWKEWKNGKKFWIPVLFTIIALIVAFGIGTVISALLPNIDDGMGVFRVVDLPSLLAFAITTIFLPAIAEEAFYRKGIINFENSVSLVLTSVIGIFLFASEHSLKPLGLLTAAIWAVPLTISYIKTKNVYISITTHFICNLTVNGMTVVFTAIKILEI